MAEDRNRGCDRSLASRIAVRLGLLGWVGWIVGVKQVGGQSVGSYGLQRDRSIASETLGPRGWSTADLGAERRNEQGAKRRRVTGTG